MRTTIFSATALLAAAIVAIGAQQALAQSNFPSRPIRLIVPFAPGGGVDTVTRIVGQKFSEKIGQPILVESKPGAGGALAVNELLRSDADGHTLLVTTSSHATLPALHKLTWHPSNDFATIAAFYSSMYVMPTNSANPFKTFKEMMAYAKANPGKLNWGSSGIAGPQHLGGAEFMKAAGINAVHVPYRGNGPMLQALLANDVQLTFDTLTLNAPHIDSGKLIPLAVTGDKRLPNLPNVPTVKESGVDYSTNVWVFVLAPKGIPVAVQNRLNQVFVEAIEEKDVRNRLLGFGLDVPERSENTTVGIKKHIDDFATTYGKLITDLGIKAE